MHLDTAHFDLDNSDDPHILRNVAREALDELSTLHELLTLMLGKENVCFLSTKCVDGTYIVTIETQWFTVTPRQLKALEQFRVD
jgi:hypothetical protein